MGERNRYPRSRYSMHPQEPWKKELADRSRTGVGQMKSSKQNFHPKIRRAFEAVNSRSLTSQNNEACASLQCTLSTAKLLYVQPRSNNDNGTFTGSRSEARIHLAFYFLAKKDAGSRRACCFLFKFCSPFVTLQMSTGDLYH